MKKNIGLLELQKSNRARASSASKSNKRNHKIIPKLTRDDCNIYGDIISIEIKTKT